MLPEPKNIEIENRDGSRVFVCRNATKKKSFIVLPFIGLYWLVQVWLWGKFTSIDFYLLPLGLSALYTVYLFFILAFGKTTFEISKDEIFIHKIQFPFPTKKTIKTKNIEEIVCETN